MVKTLITGRGWSMNLSLSFVVWKKVLLLLIFRRVRDNSVSRQPESFEFNVKQRLEVVSELEKIKAQKAP